MGYAVLFEIMAYRIANISGTVNAKFDVFHVLHSVVYIEISRLVIEKHDVFREDHLINVYFQLAQIRGIILDLVPEALSVGVCCFSSTVDKLQIESNICRYFVCFLLCVFFKCESLGDPGLE